MLKRLTLIKLKNILIILKQQRGIFNNVKI